jgi:hypothetical protein
MSLPGEIDTMDARPVSVTTIAGVAEVDRAIATLVLAFGTDPIARWMYDDPHQYLEYIPRLFRALGTGSFEAGAAHRTGDGLGVSLWLPPGVHGDDGLLEAVVAESIVGEKQAEVGAPLVPVAYRRRGLASEQRLWRSTPAARPSPMRPRPPSGIPLVIEPAKCLFLRAAWL